MKKVLIPIVIVIILIIVITINFTKEKDVDNTNNNTNYISKNSLASRVRSEIEDKLNSAGIKMEREIGVGRLTLGRGEKYMLTSEDAEGVIEIYEIDAKINKMLNNASTPGEKEIDGEKYWIFEDLIIKFTSNTTLNDVIKNSLVTY